jgi:hypothetical protein
MRDDRRETVRQQAVVFGVLSSLVMFAIWLAMQCLWPQ